MAKEKDKSKPKVVKMTDYDILWNDLPKEVQEQLMDEEESL